MECDAMRWSGRGLMGRDRMGCDGKGREREREGMGREERGKAMKRKG